MWELMHQQKNRLDNCLLSFFAVGIQRRIPWKILLLCLDKILFEVKSEYYPVISSSSLLFIFPVYLVVFSIPYWNFFRRRFQILQSVQMYSDILVDFHQNFGLIAAGSKRQNSNLRQCLRMVCCVLSLDLYVLWWPILLHFMFILFLFNLVEHLANLIMINKTILTRTLGRTKINVDKTMQ